MSSTSNNPQMRNAVRFPLRLPVAVKVATEEHQAETRDISAGGVLFHIDAEMSVGSTIEFTIAMPAGVIGAPADVLVNCLGRVVRCSEVGDRRAVAAVIDEYHIERA